MKKVNQTDELRPEYSLEDLGQGVRCKYYDAYREGINLVLLSPDVAKIFPTGKDGNEALRSLINLAEKSTELAKPSNGRAKKAHSG